MSNLPIDTFKLKKGKRYRFYTHYDLIKDTEDKSPHFYDAKYNGRKGISDATWVFTDFTDIETNEKLPKKEIKFFPLKHPQYLYDEPNGGKRKTSRRKIARRKTLRRKTLRRKPRL
jgi:hypothetical protein